MAGKIGGPRPGSGRPKGGHNKTTLELQGIAQQYAPAAIAKAVWLLEHGRAEATRIAAINIILDRAYGRPPQGVTIAGNLNHAITVIKRIIVDLDAPESVEIEATKIVESEGKG